MAPSTERDEESMESAGLLQGEPRGHPAWERAAWALLVAWAFVGPALVATALRGRDSAASKTSDGALTALLGEAEAKPADESFYHLFSQELKGAKYVDLTHAFAPSSPVWPGFGQASFADSVAGIDMAGGFVEKGQAFTWADHGFQATSFVLTTDQYGTQLDPPAHWSEFGATISDVPPTVALRPLVVLDVHDKVAKNASYHATVEDAEAWEDAHGKIPAGSVVFVRSDWSKGWQRYAKEGLPSSYPGVSLRLLKWLHLERKILFHGHEPLDTDMTPNLEGEGWLMHKNFMQAEGVANLHAVPEFGCLVSIGFAKPQGGLGGFARYVAICPPSAEGITVEEAPGAPLPESKHPLRRDGGVMKPTPKATPIEYCKNKQAMGCTPEGPVWEQSQ